MRFWFRGAFSAVNLQANHEVNLIANEDEDDQELMRMVFKIAVASVTVLAINVFVPKPSDIWLYAAALSYLGYLLHPDSIEYQFYTLGVLFGPEVNMLLNPSSISENSRLDRHPLPIQVAAMSEKICQTYDLICKMLSQLRELWMIVYSTTMTLFSAFI